MDAKVIRLGAAVLVGALLIMTIALLSVSFKKLNSDEVGLKYNVITKSLDKTVFTEGLHYGPPGFYFIIFPSVFKTLVFDDLTCLNKDGVEIQLDVTYQYQVKPKNLHRVVMQFKDHEGYRQILSHEGSAATYETCAQYNTSQFQSERGGFQSTLRELILERYSALECNIKDLQVNNIVRPSKYEAAIKAKESAKKTITIVLNERPKKLTTAKTGMLKAKTQAQIMVEKSKSDAQDHNHQS